MDGIRHVVFRNARFFGKESGQTLVEYALIIMLVAIALVLALGLLAGGLDDFYRTAAAAFP